MRLEDESENSNVEDRRGGGMARAGGVGIGAVVSPREIYRGFRHKKNGTPRVFQ